MKKICIESSLFSLIEKYDIFGFFVQRKDNCLFSYFYIFCSSVDYYEDIFDEI